MTELWNTLPIPAIVLTHPDRIVKINPAAEVFFNRSSLLLADCAIWDHLNATADVTAAVNDALQHRRPLFVSDVTLSGRGFADRPCNIQCAPFPDDSDQTLVTLQRRDIEGQLPQDGQARRAAKSAIGMAEMLAHEIKNPLAGITGAAQLLSMTLPPQDQDLTDLIVTETRRIVALLEQVEQFGNVQPPQLQAVNIHDVIDRAKRSAALGFGAHMRFVETYDPSLPPTYADADMLVQVLLNLIKNACEACATGGTITLKTYYDAGLRRQDEQGTPRPLPLQIEVIDTGPGLPPAIAAHIFDPFVSGRENGTGLGLALVSKLIDDIGGWITVARVQDCTVFRLSLPRAPDTAAAELRKKG